MKQLHLIRILMLLQLVLWPFSCHCLRIYDPLLENIAMSWRRNDSSKDNRLTSAPVRTIHLGYVYDDADDVIHIIEPPQHFQALKRRQKQQTHQQPQVKNLANAAAINIMKVKELPQAALSPATISSNSNSNRLRRRPTIDNRDLLTQETQAMQSRTEDLQLPLVVKFPMEILASVRQTERILQQRQKPQPKSQRRSNAKQRIKTQQTHTVITEQGYEKSHFKRGKEQRLGGHQLLHAVNAKAVKRVRRETINVTNNAAATTPQQAALASAPKIQAQAQSQPQSQTQTKSYDSNVEQGAELLLRLGALLKNATLYLPDDSTNDADAADEAVNVIATPQNSLLHELRTRFQQQGAPKKLIGEIEPTTANKPTETETLLESDIFQLLENSLNATDALMQQIMRKQQAKSNNNKLGGLTCNQQSLFEAGDSLQQYQMKIDCMRQQLEAVQRNSALPPLPIKVLETAPIPTPVTTATTTTTTARGHRRYGSRSTYKLGSTATAITTLAPTTATATQNHNNLVAAIRQRQRFNKKSTTSQFASRIQPSQHSTILKTKAATQLLDARNVSAAAAALLYDDVMTNIRNMLEAKHLKLLISKPVDASPAESTKTHAIPLDEAAYAAASNDDFIEASSTSSSSQIDATAQAENHFRDLSYYLDGLQQMMSRFPTMTSTPISIVPHELAHARNSDGGSDASNIDWYLVNDEGKISQTSFNFQLPPSALMFHNFPDIPNAAFYLRNHAAPAAQRSDTSAMAAATASAVSDGSDFEFN